MPVIIQLFCALSFYNLEVLKADLFLEECLYVPFYKYKWSCCSLGCKYPILATCL